MPSKCSISNKPKNQIYANARFVTSAHHDEKQPNNDTHISSNKIEIELKLVYCNIDNIIGRSVGKIESAHKSHLAMSVICYLFRFQKILFSIQTTYQTQTHKMHTLLDYIMMVRMTHTYIASIFSELFTCTHVHNVRFSAILRSIFLRISRIVY